MRHTFTRMRLDIKIIIAAPSRLLLVYRIADEALHSYKEASAEMPAADNIRGA